VLSRTDEYLERLAVSLRPSWRRWGESQIIVGDNGLSSSFRRRWPQFRYVPIPDPFNFAAAVNRCVRTSESDRDLVVINDDTRIVDWLFPFDVESALTAARRHRIGLFSPQILGGVGNGDQRLESKPGVFIGTQIPICFVCAVIPREIWTIVGELDESFRGYGFEDADYSRRVVEAGYHLAVAGWIQVEHGFGEFAHSSTFRRVYDHATYAGMGQHALKTFTDKWGRGPQLGSYERGARYA
jgi:hypothetical protein